MGIHFNHKSKAGDRKMQKELKLKMKAEESKKKREEQERLKQEEEMRKLEELTRPDSQETPIFISHGAQDDVLPILNFNQSIDILKKDNYNFESHLIEKDTHTMSPDTIKLFQNFIKKNI